jgi:endonuclease G
MRRRPLNHELRSAAVSLHARRFLRLANVTSLGIGYKRIQGVRTDDLSLQFTVNRKLSGSELAVLRQPVLPSRLDLPDGTNLWTDVVERSYRLTHGTPPATPSDPRTSRTDPVRPGASIGQPFSGPGTVAAIVYRVGDGAACLLSAWHVLAGPGMNRGDGVFQPAVADGGEDNANRIGSLLRSYGGLDGDAAVASIEARSFEASAIETGLIPRRAQVVDLDDPVIKSGRTTGVTRGVVSRTNVEVWVPYRDVARRVQGFEIAPSPASPPSYELSDGGDSGSLWMIDKPAPDNDIGVGLQIMGESDPNAQNEHSFACYVHRVLDLLGISFTAS